MKEPYIAGSINPIDTGEHYFKEIAKLLIAGRDPAIRELERARIIALPVAEGKPLDARVEHARWIVDCPNCNGAEFLFEDKLFYCQLCHNADVGGKTRKVKVHKDRKKIEELLAKRPIKNRHWYPNETVDDLEKENNKQGVK
jgi:hypothetical protein